jgi:hypothetical protein
MVKRAAEEQFGAERTELNATIAWTSPSQVKALTTVKPHHSTNFNEQLSRLAPDWEAVDADPKWIEWLGEYDPRARRVRQALLDEAIAAGDAQYVAELIAMRGRRHTSARKAIHRSTHVEPSRVAAIRR